MLTENKSEITKEKKISQRESFVCFLLSCIAVFTLHCKFEIFGGGFPDSALLNGLNKLYNTFYATEFADIFTLTAVYLMLRFVVAREEYRDTATMIFSLILSVTLVVSISFHKFNSADFLFANVYQLLISLFCIVGFWIILYGIIRCVCFLFEKAAGRKRSGCSRPFLEKHFFLIGFAVIFLGWLPWIVMNYPGSGCPDSVLQLREFFGDAEWGAGHPPLSTVIMGSLFSFGRFAVDANFGYFLYCLMQTCAGAAIFTLSMKKLKDIGVPAVWCLIGIAFFAFTPFWGTYAQWVEKDLLYAEAAVLQTVCMMDILVRRQCSTKNAVLLAISTLFAVFLRNNGIYAVLPALILLAVWLKAAARRRIAVVTLSVVLFYEGAMKLLYPALDIQGLSVIEALSIPFQQTARYVCEHSDEVTEEERAVIEEVFGYEFMFHYDPVISDPIKIHCKTVELGEYYKIWFKMFFKHPETYVAAFINKGYGYLAPVSQNIEAWIQTDCYPYMEQLGVYHVFDEKVPNILGQIWNLSQVLPLVRYLCTPGLYTWIVVVLAMILMKYRKRSALILFVPSLMNILVCLASPLAGAIRYELPAVASVPMLIGWAYYSIVCDGSDRIILQKISEDKPEALTNQG